MHIFKMFSIFLFSFFAGGILMTVETVQNSNLFKKFEKDSLYSSSSLLEVERKSLAECAALCEQKDECLSFNYNRMQQQCRITDSYPSEGIKDVIIELKPGWEIYYKENHACEFSFTTHLASETVSTITSPNYPNNYNNNTDRYWLIIKPTVAPILYLNFTDFKVGDGMGPDHVVVYDGACKDAPIHATLRGETTSLITDTSGLYVLVNLISDAGVNHKGFTMDFYLGKQLGKNE